MPTDDYANRTRAVETLRRAFPTHSRIYLVGRGSSRRHAARIAVFRISDSGMPVVMTAIVATALQLPYEQTRECLLCRKTDPTQMVSTLGSLLHNDPFALSVEWL